MGLKALQPLCVASSRAGKRRISKAQAEQNVILFLRELGIQREGRKSLGSLYCEMVKFLRRCCNEEMGTTNVDRGERFALGPGFQQGLTGWEGFSTLM